MSFLQNTDCSRQSAEDNPFFLGFIVLMSLLVGAMAGMFAPHVAATAGGKARVAVAPASPSGPSGPLSSRPAVRRIDTQLVGGEPQVTILLDQLIPYDAHRLDNPDRVYVDLHGASAAPQLSGSTLFVKSGGISTIRTAQTQLDTVRMVLDLDKRFDYSVSQRTNPPTLVVRLSPASASDTKRRSAKPKANKPAQQ